jgi:hypothetical protein
MTTRTYAVLIADVVGSTSRSTIRSLLSEKLRAASHVHQNQGLIRLPYSVTAGDEFQAISDALTGIPRLILDLRRKLRPLRFRVGIGLGDVRERIQAPVNRLGGDAFQYARKALESIKKDGSPKFRVLTSFRSKNEMFDTTANLVYILHDTLVLKITQKQWDTIDVFWRKRRLEDAAKGLDLDVSTVSRNLKRGYFWQLEETVNGMRRLIEHSFL